MVNFYIKLLKKKQIGKHTQTKKSKNFDAKVSPLNAAQTKIRYFHLIFRFFAKPL